MNSYLPNLEQSTLNNSEAMNAYELLRNFFEQEKKKEAYSKIFSSERVFDLAGGLATSILAKVISRLVNEGVIDQIIRVEPRFGEGIGDFSSIQEIPDVISDWRNPGMEVLVKYEHLKVYYKLHMNAAS